MSHTQAAPRRTEDDMPEALHVNSSFDTPSDQRGPDLAVRRWLELGEWGELLGEITVHPVWLADGSRFAFVDENRAEVVLADPTTDELTTFVDADTVNKLLTDARASASTCLPFHEFRLDGSDRRMRFAHDAIEWSLDLDRSELVRVTDSALESEARARPGEQWSTYTQIGRVQVPEVPSPDGRFIATVRGHDLALRSTHDGRTHLLTMDGEDLHEWSLALVRWSADGRRLLAAKTDWRQVPTIPIVSWDAPRESVSLQPYPRAGQRQEIPRFHVFDVISGRSTVLDLPFDAEHHNVVPLGFVQDEAFFLVQDHGGVRWALVAAECTSGRSRIVIEEAGSASRLWDAAAQQVFAHRPSDTEFLWLSDRDGWNHLYLYELDGTLVRQVTTGEYAVDAVVAIDPTANALYFTARCDPRRPYDLHLCRIGLDGQGFAQLTTEPGDHHIRMAPAFTCFLDLHSAVDRPHRTDLRDMTGQLILTLHEVDTSRLQEIGWTPPQEFCVKAADGVTDLFGVLFLPPDFDPTRTYPIVESIYGGPQSQVHPNTFELGLPKAFATVVDAKSGGGYDWWMGYRAMRTAQLGFVTLVLDGRGTPGRGRAFHDVVLGKMGQFEIADHAGAIRQLAASRPWMDLARVGIFGLSWGGYMTLRAVLQAPELYKVGIASATPTGHDDSWGGCTIVHGLPQENPDTYELGSNLPVAGNLRGKLLIIHGTHDANAPFGSAMKMVDAFARAGKTVDTLFMAGMKHFPEGWQMRYVNGVQARYLVTHLQPEGVRPEDIPLH